MLLALGGSKAGKLLARAIALDANANHLFVFGARFAQYGHGGEGLGVDPSYQIGFAAAVLLPKLANLNFGDHRGALKGLNRM